jgi:hypothetical protein
VKDLGHRVTKGAEHGRKAVIAARLQSKKLIAMYGMLRSLLSYPYVPAPYLWRTSPGRLLPATSGVV